MKLNILKSKCAQSLKKLLQQDKGSIMPFVAITLPVIFGIIGLGTDASLWMSNKRILQTAADSSVISAGWEIAQDSYDLIDSVALREAIRNGYDPSKNGTFLLEIISETSDGTTIGVSLEQDADIFFSQIIYHKPVRIGTYAEAFIGGLQNQFCFMSLHQTDPNSFTTSGSVTVNVPDCGVTVNSNHDNALSMNGNVDLTFHEVRIVGGYEITGGSADFNYDILRSGVSPIQDPYADMTVDDIDGRETCSPSDKASKITTDTTFSPGTYCGGFDISGTNDIVFEPGIYFLDGGGFDVSGGGSLFGEGVTFILTGSGNDYANLNITGGRSVDFAAPLEGEEMAGIVFFQDPEAPYNNGSQTKNNRLTGSADITINGTGYFPTRDLYFGGDNSTDSGNAPCTRMIAQHIIISGNPSIGNQCDGYDVEDIGTPLVYLVK